MFGDSNNLIRDSPSKSTNSTTSRMHIEDDEDEDMMSDELSATHYCVVVELLLMLD